MSVVLILNLLNEFNKNHIIFETLASTILLYSKQNQIFFFATNSGKAHTVIVTSSHNTL
jgi:hypothetical protein